MTDEDTMPIRPLKERDQNPLPKIVAMLRHTRIELARLAMSARDDGDRQVFARAVDHVQRALGEIE
jgi:hypothetical protein